ncbi:glycosyl transferase [Clostridium sp. SHJSY1]|uniref:macrolide family glycosyltransferase n=1 Tax=Clostridium sp. SHJSY1 TaxID=2942483 RepID=UPI0028753A37|nr:macrolide family glycosyltransferase [Clostridium sp. SHJSY1]MDS0528503.1 glycosyl transferase [Clostridium sp. SHJSY1]
MAKVLFLGIPAYGHLNPTLGIVSELIKRGEEVVYFCNKEFKEKIENTGAVFRSYGEFGEKISILAKSKKPDSEAANREFLENIFETFIAPCEGTIESILEQIKDINFDYIGYSSVFPYGSIIAKILKIPSFSSFAIFATKEEMASARKDGQSRENSSNNHMLYKYKEIADRISGKYDIDMPESIVNLLFNRGDINLAYTSKDFVSNAEAYDETFKFIGPPIYDRKEDVSDFPYKEIEGKKVIYISLGTVYNNVDLNIYKIFFEAFKDLDVVVAMTAYNIDLSDFDIPKNFIIKNYISQGEILKYAKAAITHAGMNTTNDLLFNKVPFVAIPLGADQPYMASRTESLGASITLEKDKLTPEILRESINKVLTEPKYIENIKRIDESFRECGGYKRAVDEILRLQESR